MEYNKYFLYKRQISYDGGQTWVDTYPLETTTSGDPIATCDTLEECESVTPKFCATYNDGTSYIIDCTSTGDTLTSADTRGHSTAYSAMTEAVIGNCVTTIGTHALGSADNRELPSPYNLTSVTISDSVTTIKNSAFLACSALIRCDIPNGVTSIGDIAFNSCESLTSVTIPSGVTVINKQTFSSCHGLTRVVIHDNVVRIRYRAFYDCRGLTSVVIGNGVTDIEDGAFAYCANLQSILVHATTPPIMTKLNIYAFQGTNDCPIYVPAESVDAYKAASGWSSYASRIQAIP